MAACRWVKLFEKFGESEIAKNPEVWRLFCILLVNAEWRDFDCDKAKTVSFWGKAVHGRHPSGFNGDTVVRRGWVYLNASEYEKKYQIRRQSVLTHLKWLRDRGMVGFIAGEGRGGGYLVFIKNYDKYQGKPKNRPDQQAIILAYKKEQEEKYRALNSASKGPDTNKKEALNWASRGPDNVLNGPLEDHISNVSGPPEDHIIPETPMDTRHLEALRINTLRTSSSEGKNRGDGGLFSEEETKVLFKKYPNGKLGSTGFREAHRIINQEIKTPEDFKLLKKAISEYLEVSKSQDIRYTRSFKRFLENEYWKTYIPEVVDNDGLIGL